MIVYDLSDGDRVDRTVASIEIEDSLIDDTMSRIVEVIPSQEIGNMDDTILVDEERAENSALGVDAMWGSGERQL